MAKKMTKEAAHDTRLLELHGELARAEDALDRATERALNKLAWRPMVGGARADKWVRTNEYGMEDMRLRGDIGVGELVKVTMFARGKRRTEIRTVTDTEGNTRPVKVTDLPDDVYGEMSGLRDAFAAAHEAVVGHERAYTGWDRYWLVTTSNGHVHADRACRTLRPTTGLALVPMLSGTTAAAAIDLLGNTMCTVCFPDAPVDPMTIPAKVTMVLMEEGEDAFLRAMRKHTEGTAKKVKCAGGGTRNYEAQRFPNGALRKYQRCGVCGAAVTVTTIGALRAHTPAS